MSEVISIYNSKIQNLDDIQNLLKTLDIQNYNQIPISDKIDILLALINAAEDLPEIKEHHSVKSESAQDLVKEKGKAQRKLNEVV